MSARGKTLSKPHKVARLSPGLSLGCTMRDGWCADGPDSGEAVWAQAFADDLEDVDAEEPSMHRGAGSTGHEGGNWFNAMQQDQEEDLVELDTVAAPRKRGRPKNSRGSGDLREAVAQKVHDQQAQQEQQMAAEQPVPGSIEYARAIKKQRDAERAASKQSEALGGSGRVTVLSEACIGNRVQRAIADAWSRCRGLEAGVDPALQTVLGRVAVAASARTVARLLRHVPGSLQDMIGQAGAAVFPVGTWLWSVLLTYLQRAKELRLGTMRPAFRQVMMLIKLKYDETPARIRVGVSADGQHHLLSRRDPQEITTHAKVMQVQHCQGVLLQSTQDKTYHWCFTDLPSRLSAVDRTTGECIRAVLHDHVTSVPATCSSSRLEYTFCVCALSSC